MQRVPPRERGETLRVHTDGPEHHRQDRGQGSVAGSTRTENSGNGTGGSAPRRLVIVESPSKARKIASYLGRNFVVESSKGHIRDLPRKAADVPAKYKGEAWASLGVNVDAAFEPHLHRHTRTRSPR